MNKKFNTFFLSLFFLGFSLVSYAQVDKNPPSPTQKGPLDGGPGVPGLELPIDRYIPFFILVALVMGIIFLRNQERVKTSNP